MRRKTALLYYITSALKKGGGKTVLRGLTQDIAQSNKADLMLIYTVEWVRNYFHVSFSLEEVSHVLHCRHLATTHPNFVDRVSAHKQHWFRCKLDLQTFKLELQTLTVLLLLPGQGRNAVKPYTSLHSLRLAVMLISWFGFSVMLVLYIIVPVCRQETL